MSNLKNNKDFDIQDLVSIDKHEQDLDTLTQRISRLEQKAKILDNSDTFGDFFSNMIGKSAVINSTLENKFDNFLKNFKPNTKKQLKVLVDEINKDNSWLKLGMGGQFAIQVLLSLVSGFLLAVVLRWFLPSK